LIPADQAIAFAALRKAFASGADFPIATKPGSSARQPKINHFELKGGRYVSHIQNIVDRVFTARFIHIEFIAASGRANSAALEWKLPRHADRLSRKPSNR
jgi:hypothetical protein